MEPNDNPYLQLLREITEVKNRINELGVKLSAFYDNAHEKSQADIAYVAMMSDVEIEEDMTDAQ